jgi:hypothetical protein
MPELYLSKIYGDNCQFARCLCLDTTAMNQGPNAHLLLSRLKSMMTLTSHIKHETVAALSPSQLSIGGRGRWQTGSCEVEHSTWPH